MLLRTQEQYWAYVKIFWYVLTAVSNTKWKACRSLFYHYHKTAAAAASKRFYRNVPSVSARRMSSFIRTQAVINIPDFLNHVVNFESDKFITGFDFAITTFRSSGQPLSPCKSGKNSNIPSLRNAATRIPSKFAIQADAQWSCPL